MYMFFSVTYGVMYSVLDMLLLEVDLHCLVTAVVQCVFCAQAAASTVGVVNTVWIPRRDILLVSCWRVQVTCVVHATSTAHKCADGFIYVYMQCL